MTIATSENLHVLLQVQEKDSQILAANHEIKELPERKEIEATQEGCIEELNQVLKAKESEVHENNRIQKRLEDEVATVEERIENQKRKLYGGEVIAIKELQALEMDIESLKERQIAIEDQIIEVMELNEPIQSEIQNLTTQQEENKENEANLSEALQEAIKKLNSE